VEIAKGIGWSDEGVDEEDEDVDWDDLDGEPSVRKEQGKGKLKGGMAASVSVMADEEGEQG
jgi:hypothetical protein